MISGPPPLTKLLMNVSRAPQSTAEETSIEMS